MRPHYLLNKLYRLVPLGPDRKDRLKAAIYRRAGRYFAWSPNYREWRRNERLYRKLDEPSEPTDAQWHEVESRRREAPVPEPPPGHPYVVVPVYKGRAETLACLYSVLEADPQAHLVVIDDASPDAGLAEALDALAARGLFELHRNERNLGFAPTVNRGMRLYAERDVVLLNSDTFVYGDWLERLRRVAHGEAPGGGHVGTVTPLTNNGELASYPRWMEDNPHQLEIDHRELDAMAAEVNAGLVFEVPTGVGFCLYIRRDCLDAVGDFDERYAAGYGEENEFCLRAAEAGYESVLAADVFVTHFGSVSFGRGRSKRRKMVRALERLKERYPDYEREVGRFIARDPMVAARLRLDAARIRRAARQERPARTVLMVAHDWGGGVEQHVDVMTRALEAEGVNVFRLQPYEDHATPAVTLRGPRLRNKRHLLPNAERIAMNQSLDELIEALRLLDVDHVHVHHAGGFGLFATDWIRALPERVGCEYDLTLHDYAPVCPRLHFNLPDGHYCGEPGLDECERCIASFGSPIGYYPMWRWRPGWQPLLDGARRVFCPSRDVADRMARYFPEVEYCVRPHPERVPRERHRAPPSSRRPGEPLRVAVPGAIGEQKGFDLVIECAEDARRRRLPIRFRVVGYTMNDERAEEAGVEVLGRYRPEEAERVIAEAECDLAFLPSLTPETWCFTLSSVLRAELFPVVFDLGALAERVREAKWGEIVPRALMKDAGAVNDLLLELAIPPAPGDLAERLRVNEYGSYLGDYYELERHPGMRDGDAQPTRASGTSA